MKGTQASITGEDLAGEMMPCESIDGSLNCAGTATMLSAQDIATIEQWILEGAPE